MAAAPQQAPQAIEAASVAQPPIPQAADAPAPQGVAQARDDGVTGPATPRKTAESEEAAGVEQQIRQADEALAQQNVAQARGMLEQVLHEIEQTGPRANAERQKVLTQIRDGVTEAIAALGQNDSRKARQALQGFAQQSQGEGERAILRTMVSVDVPEPVVTVNQSDSIVQVQQGQAQVAVDPGRAQVTVNQAAPQVRVNMPQPKITIDMPAPDILVAMPNPTVSVNVPQPQVSVDQAAPTVTVEQGKPEVQVGSDASAGTGQSDVRVEKGQAQVRMNDARQAAVSISEAQPQVRYNAAQPVVQIESEGEPRVEFVQSGEARVQIRQMSADETREMAKQQASRMQGQTAAPSEQVAQPAAASGQARDDANTAVSAASTRDMPSTVGDITGYAIVDSHVKKLGDILKVVSVNNRLYAVIGSGGLLGFGDKQMAIELSSLVFSNNALMAPDVPGNQIATLHGFKSDAYPPLEDKYPVTIGSL
ncbi:hypothetical protein CKO27_04615 [Thiocystis violacea]|nr:hypothetical protein [Thiocystis violacea]